MTDTPAAVDTTPATEAAEYSQMAEVFNRLNDGNDDDTPDVVDAAPPEDVPAEDAPAAEAEPDAVPEAIEAPADLPASIKAKWGAMAEDAREAVLGSHRELSRKMADQGRIVQVSKPVYDVIVQAAQEIPSMNSMTPAQIAHDVFAMAKIQGELNTDPVKTLLGIAQRYGAVDGMRAALAGQASDPAQGNVAMQQEIRALRAQLQQMSDPDLIDQRVSATMADREALATVSSYAASKEYWSEVEAAIPAMIPMAQQRLGAQASPRDVLDAAYDMALYANPDLRAKAMAAASAPTVPDPKLTADQAKAKSVNVVSRPGAGKPLTEDQHYRAIWTKHQA